MNAMGPQKFQEMSGGNGIPDASHIVVQSTKSRKRQEDASLGLRVVVHITQLMPSDISPIRTVL